MQSTIKEKIHKLETELHLTSQSELFMANNKKFKEKCAQWDKRDITLFVGDNLTYLAELASHHKGIVDLCYIDPPYNTGSKFLYNDTRRSQPDSLFGSHSSWMSFMLPRLVTAQEILKDNGLIAISIDDYEYANLKILMDRIFGGGNFIGNIIVCRSKNGKGSKKNIAPNHEYLLIYGKSSQAGLRGQPDDTIYDKSDQHGEYRIDGLFRKKGQESLRSERPNMYYPIFFNPSSGEVSIDPISDWQIVYPVDSKGVERRWLWSSETARGRSWQLFASKKGTIYVKNYASNGSGEKRKKVRTLWTNTEFYTERATKELKELFGKKVFDTPKPIEFIKKIIDIADISSNAVIMDFFAGSATTAHAVSELNNLDQGARKCILMETNDTIPQNHIARHANFDRISDISETRLKIVQENFPSIKYQVIE